MTLPVRTAIFPVAGLGTRFLPATKATPKELLPVLDTPLIQYAIDEVRAAGIERIVFVSHESKPAIERHVMDDLHLRRSLEARGKDDIADELKEAALHHGTDDVLFTLQNEPKGLGHAVLCARDYVLDGAVAVILPDDLILGASCLSEMAGAYEGGHMVATMTVEKSAVSKYGVLDVISEEGRITWAHGMVEKPSPEDAPSRKAVIGRYILDQDIFDALATQTPGAGGEIQLTDAIARDATRRPISGFGFSGTRFDCGSKAGMLEATLHLASQDPELASVLDQYCTRTLDTQSAA
ncbi:MAG: UTP--glucose-1-phosphate uridylyltransferase [Pelagibaca sp.]